MMKNTTSCLGKNLIVSKDAVIMEPVFIADNCEILGDSVIEKFTFLNKNTIIYTHSHINKFSIIARHVQIGVASHPYQWLSCMGNFSQYFPKAAPLNTSKSYPFTAHKKTTVGNDVWIGANAIIVNGVSIGDGSIVAAGAVVVSDIPPYSIWGGVPAKFIKFRFEKKIIQQLLEIKWWNLPIEIIAALPRNDIHASIEKIHAICNSRNKQA